MAVCCLARDVEEGLQRITSRPSTNCAPCSNPRARDRGGKRQQRRHQGERLAQWAQNDLGVMVLSRDTGTQTIPGKVASGAIPAFSLHRIGKIVSFRNQYIWRRVERDARPDILIAIDIDVNAFSIAGICHSFGAAQSWDAIFANSKIAMFYDVYALREIGDAPAPKIWRK